MHYGLSFTDSGGVLHRVGIDAISVFEAVTLAVVEFRSDTLLELPSISTESRVGSWRTEFDLGQVITGPREPVTALQEF